MKNIHSMILRPEVFGLEIWPRSVALSLFTSRRSYALVKITEAVPSASTQKALVLVVPIMLVPVRWAERRS